MVPPGWDEEEEENDPFAEDKEESGYSSDYSPTFDEENEEDYYDDDFVETPSDEDNVEDEMDAMISEGEALIEEGEYQKALEIFIDCAERFNDAPLAIFHVGQTYFMLFGDLCESEENWKDDDDMVTYKEEAESAFETSLSLDEEYYPALNSLGALALLSGETAQAVDYWKRSIEIDDEQDEIRQALSEAKSLVKQKT